MRNAVQLQVLLPTIPGKVVEQQHSGFAPGEELLQRQDLSTVTQRVLRQQAQLRQAVEHYPAWVDALYLGSDQLDGFAELHLPRVKERHLSTGAQDIFGRGKLEHVYAVQRQPVGGDHGLQLFMSFGQGDVEASLPR